MDRAVRRSIVAGLEFCWDLSKTSLNPLPYSPKSIDTATLGWDYRLVKTSIACYAERSYLPRRRLGWGGVRQFLRLLAYLLSAGLGYFAGHWFLTGVWSILVSILVAYHLFLVFLVLTAEQRTGLSLPLGSTVLTHIACLVIIICLGIGGRIIPFFRFISLCIPGLAPFECNWLFSAGKPHHVVPVATPVTAAFADTTREDYDAWMNFVAKQKPPFPKPGSNLPAEFEKWLKARNKSRTGTHQRL